MPSKRPGDNAVFFQGSGRISAASLVKPKPKCEPHLIAIWNEFANTWTVCDRPTKKPFISALLPPLVRISSHKDITINTDIVSDDSDSDKSINTTTSITTNTTPFTLPPGSRLVTPTKSRRQLASKPLAITPKQDVVPKAPNTPKKRSPLKPITHNSRVSKRWTPNLDYADPKLAAFAATMKSLTPDANELDRIEKLKMECGELAKERKLGRVRPTVFKGFQRRH